MLRKIMVAAALFGAVPVHAQAPAQDVKCFMLSNLFAQRSSNEQARKLAQVSAFYYLGRVDRLSDADLRRAIGEQQKQITPATANRDMQACAAAVQASGKRIQSFAPAPAPAAPTPPKK